MTDLCEPVTPRKVKKGSTAQEATLLHVRLDMMCSLHTTEFVICCSLEVRAWDIARTRDKSNRK